MDYAQEYKNNAGRLHYELEKFCTDRLTQLESVRLLKHVIIVDNVVEDAVSIGIKLGVNKIRFVDLCDSDSDGEHLLLGVEICIDGDTETCLRSGQTNRWVNLQTILPAAEAYAKSHNDLIISDDFLDKAESELDNFNADWCHCNQPLEKIIDEEFSCRDRKQIEYIKDKAAGYSGYRRAKEIARRNDDTKEPSITNHGKHGGRNTKPLSRTL